MQGFLIICPRIARIVVISFHWWDILETVSLNFSLGSFNWLCTVLISNSWCLEQKLGKFPKTRVLREENRRKSFVDSSQDFVRFDHSKVKSTLISAFLANFEIFRKNLKMQKNFQIHLCDSKYRLKHLIFIRFSKNHYLDKLTTALRQFGPKTNSDRKPDSDQRQIRTQFLKFGPNYFAN